MPESILKVHSESKFALSELVQYLDPVTYLELSKPDGQLIGKNSLLRVVDPGKFSVTTASCNDHWYQNLGLLMNVYLRSQDKDIKKLVGFLAHNYLAKAAPICPRDMCGEKQTQNKLYELFQLPLQEPGVSYNRESALFDDYFRDGIANALASGSGPFCFLTDTKNIEEVFPLSFHTIDSSGHGAAEDLIRHWAKAIFEKTSYHFEKGEEAFNDFFDPPLLVDFTSLLEQDIYTFGDPENNSAFEFKLRLVESWFELAVDEAVGSIYESVEMKQKLKAFILTNMTAICRCEVNEIGVLKILPLFFEPAYYTCAEGESLLEVREQTPERLAYALFDLKMTKSKVEIENFLNETGIRLGSIRGRWKVFDFISLEEFIQVSHGTLVEYVGTGENVLYYENALDFITQGSFRRFEEFLDSENSYLQLLGKPTLLLLKGLLSEICNEQWEKVNQHPELRELVQTALVKINVHCGMAVMDKSDFSKFAQWMELIHYEIASLLAIFSPFQIEEFHEIFAHLLKNNIPKELQGFLKVGLSKSAMNTFAGISAALKKTKDFPVRVYDPGSHFEIVQFIGQDQEYDEVLKDDRIKIVDVYLGEFNHNVRLQGSHDTYTPGNVVDEVTALLKAKSSTKQLTVAIDSTIDFLKSPQAMKVLRHFSKDIVGGSLNVIFFRSGQKFDMFGMDHFYGSSWYMLNNGEKQWDSFNVLSESQAFQADYLSLQWFCLAHKYTPEFLDLYRKAIFENTKEVLLQVPKVLLPGGNSRIKVCQVEKGMEPCFLDIKCYGDNPEKTVLKLKKYIFSLFAERNIKIHTRGGYGYFHPNVVLFMEGLDKDKNVRYTTMRLHPGINPKENGLIVELLKEAERMVSDLG